MHGSWAMNTISPRLQQLFPVPRALSRQLEPLVPEDHPWSVIGAWIMLVGVVTLLGAGALAWFRLLPWSSLALGAALCVAGWSIRRAVHERSIAAGRERLARLPMSLVTVVQANNILFDQQEASLAPAVIAYARGEGALDADFMLDVAQRVASLRGRRTGDLELDRIGALLDNEQSDFRERVPPAWTGGAEVTIFTTHLTPDQIPGGYLHGRSVLACFLDEQGRFFDLLPAAAYQ